MRFVTFKKIFNEDPVSAEFNPVLEYGLPVAAEPGVVYRTEKDGFEDNPPVMPFFMQSMEEVGLLSSDGACVLPLAVTGYSFPDMNTLIAESTPQMLDDLRGYARLLDRVSEKREEKGGSETIRRFGRRDQKDDLSVFSDHPSESRTGAGAQGWPEELAQAVEDGILFVGEEARLLSPIPVPLQDVICLGLNYTEHAEEAAAYSSESFVSKDRYPVYFSKRVFHSPGDGDPVPAYEGIVDSLDYEAELAVIIGRDIKGVTPKEVPGCIFGYTILNDFSARNLQTRHTQWYLGKSLDDYTPMGPCIVTADEFAFPPRLGIRSTVNGELRQSSTTDMLIFGIDRIVSELSAAMTLRAGTIISTGTPKGVGMGFRPPKFLKKGDVVACSIEGIGTLTNVIS